MDFIGRRAWLDCSQNAVEKNARFDSPVAIGELDGAKRTDGQLCGRVIGVDACIVPD